MVRAAPQLLRVSCKTSSRTRTAATARIFATTPRQTASSEQYRVTAVSFSLLSRPVLRYCTRSTLQDFAPICKGIIKALLCIIDSVPCSNRIGQQSIRFWIQSAHTRPSSIAQQDFVRAASLAQVYRNKCFACILPQPDRRRLIAS